MKAMYTVILLFLFSGSIFSQDRQNSGAPSLQLITRIVQHQYCDSGYSDMAQLRITLHLAFLNSGQQPLIIYRGSNLPHYVLVSLNEENARNKRYEVEEHVGWVTSGEMKLTESTKPSKEFIVLNPGESYQTQADVSIAIAIEPESQFLKPGNYVFQIIVDSWPTNEAKFIRLKEKWKKTGLLWGSPVKSEPMPIKVEKEPKLVRCE